MTPRARVLAAVNRQRPDRVPKEAGFTPVALETVKAMIELFAPGLVLAPTHVLEPEVPWENIKAFFDATEEFGKLD
ncbi:MAG: hypothetical protein FJ278_12170 [Planctomycetes bacterium]|nr:hypothetical protein [Planctomycetota bacterium]